MDILRSAGWILVVLGVGAAAAIGGIVLATFLAQPRRDALAFVVLAATLLVAIVVPVAFARVGWRLARPREEAEAVPRVRPRPIAPPATDEDVARVPEPVSACPDCGYLGIRMPTMGDGLWPGGGETGDRMVCPRCDWQGLPVRFETREEYADFLRELASSRAPTQP